MSFLKIYKGEPMGPQKKLDWYSDNGFSPRSPSQNTASRSPSSTPSSSSRSSSSGGSSGSSGSSGSDIWSWAGQNNIGMSYDRNNNQVIINGKTYSPGTIPGTSFSNGRHYVTNSSELNAALGINTFNPSTPEQTIIRPNQQIIAQPELDTTKYINELKEAQRKSRIAALETARTNALTDLDTYKTSRTAAMDTAKSSNLTSFKNALDSSNAAYDTEGAAIAPAYYDKRNQAAAASDVGAMNFAKYMAARGIKGSAGAMPEIYRNTSLQGQIGALDQAEAADQSDLARRRTATQMAYDNNVANVETAYNTDLSALNSDYDTRKLGIQSAYDSDLVGANADVDAASLQAYINQINADRAYNLQLENMNLENMQYQEKQADASKQQYIDTIGQFDNDYSAEINRVQGDGDSSNDWQIAYLQAARAQKIKDQETAAAKAAQQDIENQQAWARINNSGSGGGGLTPSQILALQKYQDSINTAKETKINDWVTRIINETSPKYSNGLAADNIYYRNGHAYPREALQKYKAAIGDDATYQEVYKRIMGGYDKNPESYFK